MRVEIVSVLLVAFFIGLIVIAWRFRKARFDRTEMFPGETIQLEARAERVSLFLRGEERMFRPVLRLTQRRLFIGQLPLFGKQVIMRYSIHLSPIGPDVDTRPMSTGFVIFHMRPDQFQWESAGFALEPEEHGGMSGIPRRLEFQLAPDVLAQFRAAIEGLRLG